MTNRNKHDSDLAYACSVKVIMGGLILLAICLMAVIFTSCAVYEKMNDAMGWPDDNIVEEIIEDIIEKQTGAHIDLTPRSPEVE